MLPRLTWPTCIKHASLGACMYICISITVKELRAPRSTKRFHFVGFTKGKEGSRMEHLLSSSQI